MKLNSYRKYILSVDEMKQVESHAFNVIGITEREIIETVGEQCAKIILAEKECDTFIGVIGSGNNGADTVSSLLKISELDKNAKVFVYLVKETNQSEELKFCLSKIDKTTINRIDKSEFTQLLNNDEKVCILDGILGTGFSGQLSDDYQDIISEINNSKVNVVSIDIPSGLNDESKLSICANKTIAIAFPKKNYFTKTNYKNLGKLYVVDGGFPRESLLNAKNDSFLAEKITSELLERDDYSYKNKFGHVLVVGGSPGMTGAACLSARSCIAMGVGLVTVATHEDSYLEMAKRLPAEVMISKLSDIDFKKFDVVIIGPGLGQSPESKSIVKKILKEFIGPVIIDADGINVLNVEEDAPVLNNRYKCNRLTVLTPHIGEFNRLLKSSEGLSGLHQFCEKVRVELILKDSVTKAYTTEDVAIVSYAPNSAMAKAGAGDVFTGILGGLIAINHKRLINLEKLDILESALVIQGEMGKRGRQEIGQHSFNASKMIETLQKVIKKLAEEDGGR